MKTKLDYLEKKYGGVKATAKELGISWRQYYRIRGGTQEASDTLKKLVDLLTTLFRFKVI